MSTATPGTAGPDTRRRRGAIRRLRVRLAFWSRSLLLRVVILTLFFTTVVMVGVGFVLQSQITSKLLEDKTNAALAELTNDVAVVQQGIAGVDSDQTSLRDALARVRDSLGSVTTAAGGSGQNSAGTFEPVILSIGPGADPGYDLGAVDDVPDALLERVAAGGIATQYTTVSRGGSSVPALVVGSPAAQAATASFGLFLIFPLTGEQSTVAVVQNTLLLGGVVLVVALTFIAALVAYQAVGPVRRAALVARRLAGGDLAERMPVKGPIELTTMATSFNGMADAIRAQIRQLEEFGKLQRRFTSDVSHELRTPVTTVRMAADLLHSSRDELPPHLGRSTELLVDELDRFESLLADLLEISRHDAGMAELAAEPMDVRAVVRQTCDGVRSIAAKVGVELRLVMPDHPVVADIDYRRVERILRNLIHNAIDHAEGRPVEIELAAGTRAIAITVTDRGVGLRPGEASLVFNRFWRADPSRQRQTGGTGLGLAISLEDARLHGGWLQASGVLGVGARFRLTLPREKGMLIDSSPLPLRLPGDDGPDTGSADDDKDPAEALVSDQAYGVDEVVR
ncbi:HAMP domain-containing protein [Nakamurella sp. YIM 132087]|uniref:Sensor histidine kinase MtrB n=1 Tax=Nakamurella alba TaxID=2665158 RepID=A0A7K1FHP6_9ACTN|nr:MtrAB system histidine kinase MtrB [Nakamurella alba]MTD12969.1 HAMP domain-containing protein [Nakamurella alba]